jgi:molecular chaperone Hsp33
MLQAGQTLPEMMENILGDLGLEIFPEVQMLRYHCGCSFDRMAAALQLLGRQELEDMLAQDPGAEVTCDFCNNVYQLDEQKLAALIADLA